MYFSKKPFTYPFLDPVTLSGEGEYNLNILKEIKATESFLSLDQNKKNCQNVEPYDECTTRQLSNQIKEKCGCLPLSIGVPDIVKLNIIWYLFNKTILGNHLQS